MNTSTTTQWAWWRNIAFRFAFIFLMLLMAPWTWLEALPGVSHITAYYYSFFNRLAGVGNRLLFHIRPVLVPTNGSGDTSGGWAQLWLSVMLAVIGCAIWTVADRKRKNYTALNYLLCLLVRYYIAYAAFVYGILKLFAMQMPFPNLHQLATPLGDFLPMRLSWMFIGYSRPYQVFSGAMEVLAGLLLLYRRTATMGVLMATAVFINVMMLNLCYDIPVKIFSMELVAACLFLLANEGERILCFFVLNRPANACNIYHFSYRKRWMRLTRAGLKLLFVYIAIVAQVWDNYQYYKEYHAPPGKQPVANGLYAVTTYAVNGQAIPLSLADSMRWRDVAFEDGLGSIKTADTCFRQRYRRGYFYYSGSDSSHVLVFKKWQDDTAALFTFAYTVPDSITIELRGRYHADSLYVVLQRLNTHYQLAEQQFHWLSEQNR